MFLTEHPKSLVIASGTYLVFAQYRMENKLALGTNDQSISLGGCNTTITPIFSVIIAIHLKTLANSTCCGNLSVACHSAAGGAGRQQVPSTLDEAGLKGIGAWPKSFLLGKVVCASQMSHGIFFLAFCLVSFCPGFCRSVLAGIHIYLSRF